MRIRPRREVAVEVSSLIIILQPSDLEFVRIIRRIAAAGLGEYEMEVLITVYKDSALISPHSQYDLASQVFQ